MTRALYPNVNLAIACLLAGFNHVPKAPTNTKLLFDALNGFLHHDNMVLIHTNKASDSFNVLGEFYLLNTWEAKVLRTHVDIDQLANELNLYL